MLDYVRITADNSMTNKAIWSTPGESGEGVATGSCEGDQILRYQTIAVSSSLPGTACR